MTRWRERYLCSPTPYCRSTKLYDITLTRHPPVGGLAYNVGANGLDASKLVFWCVTNGAELACTWTAHALDGNNLRR